MNLAMLIFCFFIIDSCQNIQSTNTNVRSPLVNCWRHSHEEDIDEKTMIYRPCNFKDFAPSRYRAIIDIKEDYTCQYSQLSPVDAHSLKHGVWKFDKEESVLQVIDTEGNLVFKYLLGSLNRDRMVLQNIE